MTRLLHHVHCTDRFNTRPWTGGRWRVSSPGHSPTPWWRSRPPARSPPPSSGGSTPGASTLRWMRKELLPGRYFQGKLLTRWYPVEKCRNKVWWCLPGSGQLPLCTSKMFLCHLEWRIPPCNYNDTRLLCICLALRDKLCVTSPVSSLAPVIIFLFQNVTTDEIGNIFVDVCSVDMWRGDTVECQYKAAALWQPHLYRQPRDQDKTALVSQTEKSKLNMRQRFLLLRSATLPNAGVRRHSNCHVNMIVMTSYNYPLRSDSVTPQFADEEEQ